MKKLLSAVLVIAIAMSAILMSSCSQKDETPTVTASTDNYRNYYQIWIGSFNDSDNDQIGDINGIIEKLDYLNDGDPTTDDDLGVDGIWLSPMMPSPSYHKYDVADYYSIDKDFGTLDDFKNLVTQCHKRGIKIIIDLVLNHCSTDLPLFKSAVEQAKAGNYDDDAKYFSMEQYDTCPKSGYNLAEGTDDVWYESNFSETMPEWNLDNEDTRTEMKKISDYWLDLGVDGYRLDAIKYYYFNDNQKSSDFLGWFVDTCKEKNKDAYIVGEDWSTSPDEIATFYGSGVDSLFAFNFADTSGKTVYSMLFSSGSDFTSSLVSYTEATKKANPDSINAFFLSNHDMNRIADSLTNLPWRKMAATINLLIPGNSFIYYGEELGMETYDEGDDPAKRTAMIWDSDKLPKVYANGIDYTVAPPEGGVKQQQADSNSLLNTYKNVIKFKNEYPKLARGEVSQCDAFDSEIAAYYVTNGSTKFLVVHNFNSEKQATLKVTDKVLKNAKLIGSFVSSDTEKTVSCEDNTLKMPAYSTAIFMAD